MKKLSLRLLILVLMLTVLALLSCNKNSGEGFLMPPSTGCNKNSGNITDISPGTGCNKNPKKSLTELTYTVNEDGKSCYVSRVKRHGHCDSQGKSRWLSRYGDKGIGRF